jgi:hypothetical protein
MDCRNEPGNDNSSWLHREAGLALSAQGPSADQAFGDDANEGDAEARSCRVPLSPG